MPEWPCYQLGHWSNTRLDLFIIRQSCSSDSKEALKLKSSSPSTISYWFSLKQPLKASPPFVLTVHVQVWICACNLIIQKFLSTYCMVNYRNEPEMVSVLSLHSWGRRQMSKWVILEVTCNSAWRWRGRWHRQKFRFDQEFPSTKIN